MEPILHTINSPEDLKRIAPADLDRLSGEIREVLIATTQRNGGHLASSLGAVELAIALHRVFNSPHDKIIWDVGHQCYAHKLLTGRRDDFPTLRMYGGLSGFPDPFESAHDPFSGGHAGNSISAAMGMALAGDLGNEDFTAVAVIGDGSLGSGMALEAINHAGHRSGRLIIVVNDNGMSISPSTGSISRALSCADSSRRSRERALRIESLWNNLGFDYTGPLDGHDVGLLEAALRNVKKEMRRPVIVHVITKKGKGHAPAESDAVAYHGISPKAVKRPGAAPSYSEAFSRTMVRLMTGNGKIVAITAAMIDGTGLAEAARRFPDRVFDVGICEQHAVTLAAGLATQGYVPIVAIYSTFLQRAYDQIINDVCLLQLPVVFAIDRAGIVGDDGKTHQGAFDVSFLRSIPNMIVSAPKDENELQRLLFTAAYAGCPMAVRYPRGSAEGVPISSEFREIGIGRAEMIRQGSDIILLAFGSTVYRALAAADQLADCGVECTVVNARFAKPLDEELIITLARSCERVLTVEENTLSGGFGSAVVELLARECVPARTECIGLPDRFIEHGPQERMRAAFDLDTAGIVRRIQQSFPELAVTIYGKTAEQTG